MRGDRRIDNEKHRPRSCPWCGAKRFVRNGLKKDSGLQNYKCSACDRQFTSRSASFWRGMRFPKEALLATVALKFLARASYANCLVLLRILQGYDVRSTNTVWHWVKKCEAAFEFVHKSYRKSYGTRDWRIDEIFIKCRGSTSKRGHAYIIVVSDNKNNILAAHVSTKRNTREVERTLAKIMDKEARTPRFFVADASLSLISGSPIARR